MESYKLFTLANGSQVLQRQSDSAWIPLAIDNRDYQKYLAWVAAGNTPEEAGA